MAGRVKSSGPGAGGQGSSYYGVPGSSGRRRASRSNPGGGSTIDPLPPSSPILPTPGVQGTGSPAQGRVDTFAGSNQPLPVIYGTVRTGGLIVYEKVIGGSKLVVWLICHGPINSISNIMVDGKLLSSYTGSWTAYTGTAGQTVNSNMAGNEATWTSGYPGVAYVTALLPAPTSTQPAPDVRNFTCDVQGMLVRDPRQDATLVTRYWLGAAGNASANVALAIADLKTSQRYGFGLADTAVDWAGAYTTAANDCDVDLGGGVRRYALGIKLDTSQNAETLFENLRAHCAGYFAYNNGLDQLFVDKVKSASGITFTDTGSSANISDASMRVKGSSEVPSRVTVNYIDVAGNYKDGKAEAEQPGIALGTVELIPFSYDLTGVGTYDQAMRLATYFLNRGVQDKEITLRVMAEGVRVIPGDIISVTSAQLNLSAQLVILTGCSPQGSGWTLQGELYSAAVYSDTIQTTSVQIPPANLTRYDATYSPAGSVPFLPATLVNPNTSAAIGGRMLITPSTKLTAALTTVATTIFVEGNQMASGDRVYLESAPLGVQQIEFMAITSAPSGAGPYSYTVTRDLDGSGADAWQPGDVVFNTGATGKGFIDLYSVRGVKAGTEVGPAIVGNIRNSATYNDWSPRWAIGNLNGLYGYAVDTYGVALGVPTGAWVKIDPTNGVRIGFNATTNIQLDASGNATFVGAITAASGTIGGWTIGSNSLSSGGIALVSSGTPASNKIYVGTGTYANTNTAFYVDGSGQFSLKNNLTWDGATLTLTNVVTTGLSANLLIIKPSGSEVARINGASDRVTVGLTVAGNSSFITMVGGTSAAQILFGANCFDAAGSKILGQRGAAVTAPLATIADCQRAINDIIARLASAAGHGLIT